MQNQTTIIAGTKNPFTIALAVAAFLAQQGAESAAERVAYTAVTAGTTEELERFTKTEVEKAFPALDNGDPLFFGPHPFLADGAERYGLWSRKLVDQMAANRKAEQEREEKARARAAERLAQMEATEAKRRERLAKTEARLQKEQEKLARLRKLAGVSAPAGEAEVAVAQSTEPEASHITLPDDQPLDMDLDNVDTLYRELKEAGVEA